ncbi:KPN_01571 family protein [Pseudenterobacter timonensis]
MLIFLTSPFRFSCIISANPSQKLTMNPYVWVVIALLAMDALRELMGMPSLFALINELLYWLLFWLHQ